MSVFSRCSFKTRWVINWCAFPQSYLEQCIEIEDVLSACGTSRFQKGPNKDQVIAYVIRRLDNETGRGKWTSVFCNTEERAVGLHLVCWITGDYSPNSSFLDVKLWKVFLCCVFKIFSFFRNTCLCFAALSLSLSLTSSWLSPGGVLQCTPITFKSQHSILFWENSE